MPRTDVIIVGGGPGGMSCAITLASACRKSWFNDRRIMVVDDDRSDLGKALLNNAPGVPVGTTGSELLKQLREQLAQYPAAVRHEARVLRVRRHPDRGFEVAMDDGTTPRCDILVLATGYKRWELEGLKREPVKHPRGGKSNRLMLEHDGCYLVEPELHVAGLLAGGSSQFAIAAGIGAQVAVDILSEWAGKRTHVHEVTET
ncbi:MAG: pyridine nucleotide-disulfide oxidoreductase [Phycisphaerae bacterium]|nr:pyridine nucleotide-disulfide oxidoreductase [Phycisphaerae bacterium]